MKRFFLIISMIVMLSACAANTEVDNNFTVYTSFYATQKLTEMIAGEKAEVISLIPSGVEVHDWEPGTSDMVALSKADVFIYSGMGMEPWAEKVVSGVGNPELIAVEASARIAPLEKGNSTDPHVWLNPQNAIIQLENITAVLTAADAENADYYRANMENARRELTALDNDFIAATQDFTDKEIIVTHGAFGYLCSAYGLEQYVIEGIAGESDPSIATLREVIDYLKEKENRAVFYVGSGSDKVAKMIASEAAADVYALNTFDSGMGEEYIEVMRKNLEVLGEALNG